MINGISGEKSYDMKMNNDRNRGRLAASIFFAIHTIKSKFEFVVTRALIISYTENSKGNSNECTVLLRAKKMKWGLMMSKKQSKLIRPSSKLKKNPLGDGAQEGRIFSVEDKEFDSIYHDSGKRVALNIKVEFINSNGELVYLYYAPTITWSKKGKLMKMLHDLDVVPAEGEELDINALIGMKVRATIENVERNNVVYSNIVRIQKRGTGLQTKIPNQDDSEMMNQLFDVDDIDFNDM